MTGLIFFIEQTAVGWYVLLAVGLLIFWWRYRRASYDYRATQFELERDLARYRQANAMTALVLLVEVGLVVVGVQQVVAPTIRADGSGVVSVAAQVEDGDYPTPVVTPVENVGIAPVEGLVPTDPAQQVLATPTLTPTPVGTILPNFPPAVGCDTGNATLQVPTTGMVVHQPITVVGTAFVDNFVSYKLELRGPGTFNSWIVLDERLSPVNVTSELGQFVPSLYEPGDYEFRLTVFDISSDLRAACQITMRISPPIPTDTPIPSPTPPPEEAIG